jgi:hypothetical protein
VCDWRTLPALRTSDPRRLKLDNVKAQVAEALELVETGVQDARGDFPDADASDADLYHEIAHSIAALYADPAVRGEVLRRLGF